MTDVPALLISLWKW